MRLRSLQGFKKNPIFMILVGLVASLILIPSLAFSSFAVPPQTNIQFVSPEWVAEHNEESHLRILDVRNAPLEYINDHLPGAVHIADIAFRGSNGVLPVQYWDNDKLGSIFAKSGISNEDKVLVYSNGNDVLGATMVAYLLERLGVSSVYVLDGGYAGYKAANQPTTKVFPQYQEGDFTLHDNTSIRVSLEEVEELINKPGVVFIDPRPPELFQGDRNIWIRNGHIPGAKNIPWPTFTEANNSQEELKNPHKLKSLDEIRELLAQRNIKPTDDIIVSCSTGREATLQYVVLKHLLGYPNVRIYEGSWTEYSTTDLPVETGPEKELTL
jgi:thiosulfate/3-mercaptopyruvate sulfurtransferase